MQITGGAAAHAGSRGEGGEVRQNDSLTVALTATTMAALAAGRRYEWWGGGWAGLQHASKGA